MRAFSQGAKVLNDIPRKSCARMNAALAAYFGRQPRQCRTWRAGEEVVSRGIKGIRVHPNWIAKARWLFCRSLVLPSAFASALASIAATTSASGQEFPVTRDNFGSVGTLDLPNARMAVDGELSVGASFAKNTQHYFLDWQIFPWLEGSFRYSGLSHFDPLYPVYYDRSFALKARLWDETRFWPSVVVGANDIVGTGLYSGEYVAASKRFGGLDVTAGIGWGRLGSANVFSNPLAKIFPSFKIRTLFPDITPGATVFDTLFHGQDAGAFGSIVWNTPLDGLSLMAEYSSDSYALESKRGSFMPSNQFNVGVTYEISPSVSANLAWMYGASLSGRLSFDLDPTRPQYPTKIEQAAPELRIRTADEQRAGILALSSEAMHRTDAFIERNHAKNSFVDNLWATELDITDIQLRGRNLVIRTAAKPDEAACRKVAAVLSRDEAGIETLELRSEPKARVHCAVDKVGATPAAMAQLDLAPAPPPAAKLTEIDAQTEDTPAVREKIRGDAAKQSLVVNTIEFGSAQVTIYYSNGHYFAEADAIDRLTRILMMDLPPEIESFRLVSMRLGIPQQQFTILRSIAERHQEQEGELSLFNGAAMQSSAPLDVSGLSKAGGAQYPTLYWSIFPQFRQQLFDPNNPFAAQFLAAGFASVELFRGFTLNAEAEADLYNNFNIGRASDSLLPHVRSDFVKYFTQGKNGIGELDAAYRFRLSPTVFGLLKGGYLESMFAGAGGEVLWRPEGARWAIGTDAYQVRQRDYDRLFGLQSYSAFTGHISLYYQAPWYNLNFILRAGQYLARDRGVTLEITRRFSTGMEIGAFVTKTNVSAAQFGEGSFDKGIMIRIPLGWIAPIETQSVFAMDLRPVQRDGGQRLAGDTLLWEETRRSSVGEIRNTLGME